MLTCRARWWTAVAGELLLTLVASQGSMLVLVSHKILVSCHIIYIKKRVIEEGKLLYELVSMTDTKLISLVANGNISSHSLFKRHIGNKLEFMLPSLNIAVTRPRHCRPCHSHPFLLNLRSTPKDKVCIWTTVTKSWRSSNYLLIDFDWYDIHYSKLL